MTRTHDCTSSGPAANLDAIDAWINAHPFDPGDAARRERAAEESRIGWRRGDAIGAYCVNRTIFELLHALEGSAPLRDVPVNMETAKAVRVQLARSVDAWLLAWRDFDARRRSSPAFAILEVRVGRPSLESPPSRARGAYRNSARGPERNRPNTRAEARRQ